MEEECLLQAVMAVTILISDKQREGECQLPNIAAQIIITHKAQKGGERHY